METCVYCGSESGGGYCYQSPNGSCCMADDPDHVSAYDCCPECGIEMGPGELDGVIEHVCDPERVKAYREWLNGEPHNLLMDLDWDYREGCVVRIPVDEDEHEDDWWDASDLGVETDVRGD